MGDVIRDIAHGRMVDNETDACATLGTRELAKLGLRTVGTGASGTVAMASARMRAGPETRSNTPRTPPRLLLNGEPACAPVGKERGQAKSQVKPSVPGRSGYAATALGFLHRQVASEDEVLERRLRSLAMIHGDGFVSPLSAEAV